MVLGQENCVVRTALNLPSIDSSLGPFPPSFGPASSGDLYPRVSLTQVLDRSIKM